MERRIEKTEDGSSTLFVPELNEHYHSTKGAQTESQHIFIDMGLKASDAAAPVVLEIGFGTGLNAFLTLKEAEKSKRNIHYTGVERYPLAWELIKQLGYQHRNEDAIYEKWFEELHNSPWEKATALTPHFTLHKVEADINLWTANISEPLFDIIYFDAFAPEKQPDMWSQELFNRLYGLLKKKGILTTYCAKGIVRRMLQTAGFMVERLPGPPGGKREILRATRLS